jgi:endonuclease/exonuclease/phosphatase family metal-dependent hydrolase
VLRRARAILATALGGLGAGLAAAWLLARAASDRWELTGLVSYAPAWGVLALVLVLLLASRVLAPRARVARASAHSTAEGARGRAAGHTRRSAARVRRVGWLLALGLLAVQLFVEQRVQNALAPPALVPGAPVFRLATWNVSVWNHRDMTPTLGAAFPDLALVADAAYDVDWNGLRDALRRPGEPEPMLVRFARLVVVSRAPITRWGGLTLSFPRRRAGSPAPVVEGSYEATAVFIELDATDTLGRPIVVWFVDLPSALDVPRRTSMAALRREIDAFRGPAMRRVEDPDGTRRDEPEARATKADDAAPGFPAPDIVAGDFNAPRGAWSIGLLVPAHLRSAFASAGRAWTPFDAAGFPRRRPALHLVQSYVSRDLRPVAARLIDPGVGRHRMEVVEVQGR